MDRLRSTLEKAEQGNKHFKLKLLEYEDTVKFYIKTVLESLTTNHTQERQPLSKPISNRPSTSCNSEKRTESPKQQNTQDINIIWSQNKTQVPKTSVTYHTEKSTNLKASRNSQPQARKPLVTGGGKNIFSVSLQVAKSQEKKEASAADDGTQLPPAQLPREQNLNLGGKDVNRKFKVAKNPPHTATKLGPSETIEEFFERNVGHIKHTTLKEPNLTKTGKPQTQDLFLEMSPKGRAKEKQTSTESQ
jgi:hypothetical protein